MVAGHRFRLSFSNMVLKEKELSNLAPFRVEKGSGESVFHLSVVNKLEGNEAFKLVKKFDYDIASIHLLKSESGFFRFHISPPNSTYFCIMEVCDDFRDARVQLFNDKTHIFFSINNCLMLLYAFSTANLNTLLLHASVVKNRGKGYIFLGKSGTGKSTHSRLWLEHIEGSELLNDDNPVVRIENGEVKVFGSPWSGKTPCYLNEDAILKGVVKLKQAPENKIKRLSLLQAYAVMFPACSNMRWEETIAAGIHNSVEKIVSRVACYQLFCLPDKEAVELCASSIL